MKNLPKCVRQRKICMPIRFSNNLVVFYISILTSFNARKTWNRLQVILSKLLKKEKFIFSIQCYPSPFLPAPQVQSPNSLQRCSFYWGWLVIERTQIKVRMDFYCWIPCRHILKRQSLSDLSSWVQCVSNDLISTYIMVYINWPYRK